MNLSKFTFNKKILNGVVVLVHNQIYCQSLSKFNYVVPKKFLSWLQSFFKDRKNHKFLKFIHNNYFFQVRGVL